MKDFECVAEELGCCPHSTGELWKDLGQRRVMVGVRTQDPLGFQAEDESEVGKVKLGTQRGHFPSPVTKWLLSAQ